MIRFQVQVVALLACYVATSSAFAQAPQRPKDGVYQVFHPAGKYLVLEEFYKDGLKHGPSRRFNEQGLICAANYSKGKLDGFWREYEQGNLTSEIFYKDGEPEGVTFTVCGDHKMFGQYVDGSQEGRWTEEWKGRWKQQKNYRGGRLHGLWERTSTDGNTVFIRLTFEKGNLASKGDELKALPFLQKVSQLAASGKDPLAEHALLFLESKADLDYPETPLKEVLEDLKERFNAPIFIQHSLAEEPRLMDLPVTINDKSISISLGLYETVAEHGLTFDYRFHSFWLTTPKGAAEWKDPTGVSDLKLKGKSPLAKALPESLRSSLRASLSDLPNVIKREHGVDVDISRLEGLEWHPPEVYFQDRDGTPRPSFRDVLFLALYQNKCHCWEEGDKLILQRIAK